MAVPFSIGLLATWHYESMTIQVVICKLQIANCNYAQPFLILSWLPLFPILSWLSLHIFLTFFILHFVSFNSWSHLSLSQSQTQGIFNLFDFFEVFVLRFDLFCFYLLSLVYIVLVLRVITNYIVFLLIFCYWSFIFLDCSFILIFFIVFL